MLGTSSGMMLQIAFAYALIWLIEPAALRASKLRAVVVGEASSEQADNYLAEACECYYYGLHTACVLMCRSLLEEALERKLPDGLVNRWRSEAKAHGHELTLGGLLHKVNNYHPLLVPAKVLQAARRVNRTGTLGAHTEAVSELDAMKCFQDARAALVILLGEGR
jgi:hypothetical protein